jgi:alkylated DNA repair dioxygenase AlkB
VSKSPDTHRVARRLHLSAGAWLDLWPRLLSAQNDEWLARLTDELPWHEERYRMFGREVVAPRLVCWHGDPQARYRYSGVVHEPGPWTEPLSELRRAVDRHIASLSFGDDRRFVLRCAESQEKTEVLLGGGDLLVMRGTTQSEFQHAVIKTAKAVGKRVNLTFRLVSGGGLTSRPPAQGNRGPVPYDRGPNPRDHG